MPRKYRKRRETSLAADHGAVPPRCPKMNVVQLGDGGPTQARRADPFKLIDELKKVA